MDNVTELLVKGAAGAAGGATYVDDVFSTYLFNGNSGTQTITNGIDFAGEGGMVWCKTRGSGTHHEIADTERGTTNPRVLRSNDNSAEVSGDVGNGFTSSGFSLGFVSGDVNWNPRPNVSWSFRKQKGFFDIVTYTGNGVVGREIAHSLGSVPGCIMVKNLSNTYEWAVYHRSLGGTKNLQLSANGAAMTNQYFWNNTNPTATHFTTAQSTDTNKNGDNFVAYVFAHDDQQFGDTADQSIIKCGSYSGNGSAANGTEVNLGWEPQWLLVKNSTLGEHWGIIDSMRGLTDNGSNVLFPNQINAEDANANSAYVTPTGFKLATTNNEWNGSGHTYVYMAIRRPDPLVGKPAEAGTDVFALARGAGNPSFPCFVTGFPVDFLLQREFASAAAWTTGARLTGAEYMFANTTDAGADTNYDWGSNTGAVLDRNSDWQGWLWKRGQGFDVVTYKGNSSGDYSGDSQVISHNLGKSPEMIWAKKRNGSGYWGVYHKGLNGGTNPANYRLLLNDTHAESAASGSYTNWYWNNTAPTATQFSVGEVPNVNDNNMKHIALLFASVEGISKVGSYTGNGSTGQTIITGFQPRFVIIRRVNTTAHWLVLDTTRGWGAGDDKYLLLNASNAQGDYEVGAPVSNGFTLVGDNDYNNSSGAYIYYAHA